MRDLSREKELEQRISEMAEEYGRKKWLRIKGTFFGLSGVIYLIFVYWMLRGELAVSDIKYFLYGLVISPVLAGFLMLISFGVLYFILDSTVSDRIAIAKLEGMLLEMKSHNNEQI